MNKKVEQQIKKFYNNSNGDGCNRTVFETWLETCLIPVLRPGEWVILDNATFHHGGQIAQLIQDAGCHLLYLPPYSPDQLAH